MRKWGPGALGSISKGLTEGGRQAGPNWPEGAFPDGVPDGVPDSVSDSVSDGVSDGVPDGVTGVFLQIPLISLELMLSSIWTLIKSCWLGLRE